MLSVAWVIAVNLAIHSLNEQSYLAGKIGFRGALTVSNRAKGASKDQRPEQFFAWDILDPNHLVPPALTTSPVKS